MPLPSIKELKAIIKLCRTEGIAVIKVGDVELTLGDAPAPKSKKQAVSDSTYESVAAAFESDSLTEEELLLWSAGGRESQEQ